METTNTLKSYELKEVATIGSHEGNTKYFVDGKRVDRVTFRTIREKGYTFPGRMDCFSSSNINGVCTSYCTVRIPSAL